MKGTWDDDRDPLRALARGRPQLFEQFCESEAASFLAFFRRLGVAAAEAEDLTQEVFLKLYQASSHYQAKGRFSAFGMRVAKNAWVDWRRRRAVRRPTTGDAAEDAILADVAPATDEPPELAIRKEDSARVLAGLEGLSDAHRLVFELGVIQELPYAQIGELLEIPVGTVKSRMFHAVRRLRDVLEGTQHQSRRAGEERAG